MYVNASPSVHLMEGFFFKNMENLINVSEISVSYKPAKAHRPVIKSSSEAASIVRQFFPDGTMELQERFMAMYLNRANRVIGVYPVSVGGITGTVADPRIILAVALKVLAVNIILFHNHPSGSLQPSRADMTLTEKIKQAALYHDIAVVDHLILTSDEGVYYSFADEGYL